MSDGPLAQCWRCALQPLVCCIQCSALILLCTCLQYLWIAWLVRLWGSTNVLWDGELCTAFNAACRCLQAGTFVGEAGGDTVSCKASTKYIRFHLAEDADV